MKRLPWLVMGNIAVLLVACGARSTLEDGIDGEGGAGSGSRASTTSRTSSTTSIASSSATTWTGVPAVCDRFRLVEPVVVADTQGPARSPQLAALPSGEVLLTWLRDFELEGSAIPAFGGWPPGLATVVPIAGDVESFTLGAGPAGTTAHVILGSGVQWFVESLWPSLSMQMVPSDHGTSLFVTQLEQVWLFGALADFGAISISSYASGFVQAEDPYICSARALAAAVPDSGGILGAYARDQDIDFCDTGKAWPRLLTTARYDLGPSFDDPLVPTNAGSIQMSEPLLHLTLAPASFGAWVVYQTDGSTSRVQPPISAFRIGHDAAPIGDDDFFFAVSPSGLGAGPVAATSFGDHLAVAWGSTEPSATSITVQRVEPDQSLGPWVTVPTGIAPLAGKMQLIASTSGDQLLLGWESTNGNLGLARLDCATTP